MFTSFVPAASHAVGPTRLRAPRAYPLIISEPGTYELVENLTVPSSDTDAILVTASDVTIDLRGFVITGPVVCSGSPTTCSPPGLGFGIYTSGAAANTTIRNGTVRGMGRDGVHIASGNIEGVRAVSNGENGIVAERCVIRDSMASSNGLAGIVANSCVVTSNVASGNGDSGIRADAGPTIGNIAISNGNEGITSQGTPSGSAVFRDNMAFLNRGNGISADFGVVLRNAAYANEEFGIHGGPGVGFGFNAFIGNVLGETSAMGAHELAANLCSDDLTCP
ncbi:MAG TPA: right-handed parallel beta-helix repeat-containing protein [Candidatus Binatia bacterium]|nr:right-handed parallel beta-helix repeat-containing protein [Candidatus Binatia bacterium]